MFFDYSPSAARSTYSYEVKCEDNLISADCLDLFCTSAVRSVIPKMSSLYRLSSCEQQSHGISPHHNRKQHACLLLSQSISQPNPLTRNESKNLSTSLSGRRSFVAIIVLKTKHIHILVIVPVGHVLLDITAASRTHSRPS